MKQELQNRLSDQELQEKVPQIIFSEEPELGEFSALAWKLAYEHVKCCPGAPQSPFMDEAFAPDRVWIWDTCFMSLYCKYAPEVFPGVLSLDNFYVPMLDGIETPLKVHIADNPPLFTWAELEHYRTTGDRERLDKIFLDRKYPQRMFELFESFKFGQRFDYMTSPNPVQWEKTPLGYLWTGGRCGMDNTPRGDLGREVIDNDLKYRDILFLDAISQQALSAKIIYETTQEEFFKNKYDELLRLINEYYWDDVDKCYYDIKADAPHELVKVMTPASFWPLLAGVASQEQAEAMVKHAMNSDELGGLVPFPSVARNSPHFDHKGGYWHGGVWLPTAYMAIKSIEKYGYVEEADKLAEQLVIHQLRTWLEFEPHSIWETYSPTDIKPSTCKHTAPERYCKPDFCGWSALGPINLVIENVLGLKADAVSNTIEWRIHHKCRHGIKNLRFGMCCCSLLFDGKTIEIESSASFRLVCGEKMMDIPAGNSSIAVE